MVVRMVEWLLWWWSGCDGVGGVVVRLVEWL